MMVKKELDAYLWRGGEHVSLKLVRDDLAKYLYLPRLKDGQVLEETAWEGVASGEFFGYAQAVTDAGRYEGLRFGEAGATIYVNESSVLVHPDDARKQIEEDEANRPPIHPPDPEVESGGGDGDGLPIGGGGGEGADGGNTTPLPGSTEELSRSFRGVVEIEPARLGGSAGAISQEIE